jgi:creatinine amidohydrolase
MPDPTWGRLERLRPAQIESIHARTPVAYLPWGALEWHGVHDPVGLDGVQALGQCCALAERTGGVVLPPVYVGTDTIKPFKGFRHTLEHSVGTVRALCGEFLEQLAGEGFTVVVVVAGHCGGGHVGALREATEAFAAGRPDSDVLLVPSFEPIQEVYPSNHAARGETSFQLLFEPETVDLATIPPGPAPTLDGDGVWGEDPRTATAEEGAAMLALFVERTAPRIDALIRRHRP